MPRRSGNSWPGWPAGTATWARSTAGSVCRRSRWPRPVDGSTRRARRLYGRRFSNEAREDSMDKDLKRIVKKAHKLDEAYCVTSGKGFRLKDFKPGDTGEFSDEAKPRAKEALKMVIEQLALL